MEPEQSFWRHKVKEFRTHKEFLEQILPNVPFGLRNNLVLTNGGLETPQDDV